MRRFLNVSTRFALFFLTLWFIMATPLLAEDLAERHTIGFSPDGDFFAFEQYGLANRNGAAYDEVFIVDTHRNRWVEGSPFRAEAVGPGKLRRARIDALRQASRSLRRLDITHRGKLLASNPVTELSALPHRVAVRTHRTLEGKERPLGFAIEEVDLPTPRCRAFTTKPIKGIIIKVRRSAGDEEILHEDRSVPKSRGCPVAYRVEDVVQFVKPSGGAVYVVLYGFLSFGADGMERRFIAGGWHDEQGDYRRQEIDREFENAADVTSVGDNDENADDNEDYDNDRRRFSEPPMDNYGDRRYYDERDADPYEYRDVR